MIEFHCSRRKQDGTPVVSDQTVQDYAEAVLADYKPKLLREPGSINEVHFLESYLGATVDYQDIYYEEDANPIAGATVFNDDKVLIFDKERLCVRPIDVSAGTILIDNTTMQDGKEGFAKFTHLHEGGHLLMHPAVYKRVDNQLSIFDFGIGEQQQSHVATCRRSTIAAQGKQRLITEEDFREHQANTFAAALAMPRPTFVPCAKEMICRCGFPDGIWVEDELDWDYELGLSCLVERLADIFGVSRSAATVQLKRQHLLMSQTEYQQLNNQFAVAF